VTLSLPAAAAPLASIELLPEAKVGAGTVLLGQVARLHASDLDLIRKLVHLPVGNAPAPGNMAVLQRGTLMQWVRRHAALPAGALAWSGPEEGRVIGVAAQLRGEDIARAAVAEANAQLNAAGRAGRVEARLVPHDVALPGGEVRLEVRGLEQASWPRRLVVWVDIWSGGWFVRTVPVGLETVAGDRRAGDPADGMPLASAAEDTGIPATAHAPLTVARGDWAVLRAIEGAVTLESRVEVLQDGRTGQKVRVRQHGAVGPVLARVVGRGLLEIAP
jgi:flagella basal body P-ring formation protein FlgA